MKQIVPLSRLMQTYQNAVPNPGYVTDSGQGSPTFEQWMASNTSEGGWKDLGNGTYELPEIPKESFLDAFMNSPGLPLALFGGAMSMGGGLGGAAGSGDWASMGGGVDPGTTAFSGTAGSTGLGQPNVWDAVANQGSLASGGGMEGIYSPETLGGNSQYADWASQGGGVDPGAMQGIADPSAEAYAAAYPGGGGMEPNPWGYTSGSAAGTAASGLPQWMRDYGITGGNLLSAGGSVLGAGIGAVGSLAAANAQQKGAQSQQDLLKYMYDQNRTDLAPWRQAGVGALGNLVNLSTPGKQLDTAMLDPGYAFRQSEGEKGINRGLAARGGWDSGAALKALDRFNQNYATGEFGNVWNRNAGLAGIGQTAVGQGVNAGQNYANQAGESMLQAANARGSGYVGAANSISGGLQGLINNYTQQAMLDKILGKGG